MADIKARLLFRKGTAAQWAAANPVLLNGEPAWETDTGYFRIGDGVTAYAGLPIYTLAANITEALAAAEAAAASASVFDGVTASAAEINILDGATVTTAEVNALDGVTGTGAAVIRAATQAAGRDALGLPDFTISTSAPSGGTDGDVWFQY
ncbi:hypothetical protein [Yoonia sp.]|uniref:hyaluronate lyase N-terminal domain-containing protein n=1 Tax=Yoonia sp. TaxID=2212373 RepID=UPI002E05A67D|nr:hypothetical protein [Yoonia sp.]